jgi:hypothetical protein
MVRSHLAIACVLLMVGCGDATSSPPPERGELRPADERSERLCRQLRDEDVHVRVRATDELLDRYVGLVTGGTEEHMKEAARWCAANGGA